MDILSLLSADNYHDRFYRPPSPSSPSSSSSSSDTHLNDSHNSYPDSRSPILNIIQLNSRSESSCAAFIGLDLNSNGVVKLDEQLKDESICGICKEEREDEGEDEGEDERGDERWYELEVEKALGLDLPSRREDMRLMGSKSRTRSRSASRSRNSYSKLALSSTESNEHRVENENEIADESEHTTNPHPQKRRRKSTPMPSPIPKGKSKTKPPTKRPIPPHTQKPTPNPDLESQIRRRAQLRTAQATYRLRRDLTIAHLRKEVSLLEHTQVEMKEILVQLWGELGRRGVLEGACDDEGGERVEEEMEEGDGGERRERTREVEEFFKRLNDVMAMNGLESMETT